jgi:hypothetical protein
MESIGDVLGRHSPQQPDEAVAIKRYIADEFHVAAGVTAQPNAIVITVRSAALANTLRLRTPTLQEIAGSDKRFIFRIM